MKTTPSPRLSAPQLRRLQTLYAQACKHFHGFSDGRDARIAWANQRLGLKPPFCIASFGDLSSHRAGVLIDALNEALGGERAFPQLDAEAARRYGLDGRNDDTEFAAAPKMVSAWQIKLIADYARRLGWGQTQLEVWLSARNGPLRGRTQIRTGADANKVRWKLKALLKHRGLWTEDTAERTAA